MNVHALVPLAALLLNVALAAVAIARNPGSRLHTLFVGFVGAMAAWNFGVLMLRQADTPASAHLWEVVIHVGLAAAPVLYYHFVVEFLERTQAARASLLTGYGLGALAALIAIAPGGLLLRGVTETFWGWAPQAGPLYFPFLGYLYGFLIAGLVQLARAYRRLDSSFRRTRARLIVVGTAVTLAGGLVDFARFILARVLPEAEHIYPVGVPANALFSLLLGMSIVRYRMFEVGVAVKRAAVYAGLAVVVTTLLVLATETFATGAAGGTGSALWIAVPLGIMMTLLVSPLGQRVESLVSRAIFSRRRGCYETLLALSKRTSAILDPDELTWTLVRELAHGVPVTHCVLLTRDAGAGAFVEARREVVADHPVPVRPLAADGAVVGWLRSQDGILVPEEARVNPRVAAHFEGSGAELASLPAALAVPLTVEGELVGIVLLGDKLSGESFDAPELEVLALLASQTAIALQNAHLYAELRRSNAQLLEASRLKSEFLASMSHELRTPLNSIIGFSKVLLNRFDGDLTERQETYVRSMHTSGTHLLQLINDVLDISRIEAGRVEVHREPIDLHEIVDECLESTGPLARAKPVKLERDVPLELPVLHADRTKVKQVLLNLLSNAIKFTPGGRVTVAVRPEAAWVRVSVSDTGIGIRRDDLPRLFEPFERSRNPLARESGGTGLGLAISRKYVELHGGCIWVESGERSGSTFHFTLPLAVPDDAPGGVRTGAA